MRILTAPSPTGRLRSHAARGRSLETVALHDGAAERALRNRELGHIELLPPAQHGEENPAQAMGHRDNRQLVAALRAQAREVRMQGVGGPLRMVRRSTFGTLSRRGAARPAGRPSRFAESSSFSWDKGVDCLLGLHQPCQVECAPTCEHPRGSGTRAAVRVSLFTDRKARPAGASPQAKRAKLEAVAEGGGEAGAALPALRAVFDGATELWHHI